MPADSQEISSTTQKFLDIFDITSNLVVLRDGTVSMVLLISAMNFGLLAEQEQDSIIYAYAALLNSLNFPIQIVVNSKTKDATAYLQLLDNQIQKTGSQEKKELIKRYQSFVARLIKERNVLDKKFYVVIPAMPIEVGMLSVQTVLPGNQQPELTEEQKASVIEKAIGILESRRDHLIAQFNRIGLYARQLTTQEIIEVFYNNYNPGAYEGQQITDSQAYATAVVKASKAKAPSVTEIQAQLEKKDELEKMTSTDQQPVVPPPLKEEKRVPLNAAESITPTSEPLEKLNQQATQQPAQPVTPVVEEVRPAVEEKPKEPPMPPVAEL